MRHDDTKTEYIYLPLKPSNLAIWFSGDCSFNLPQSFTQRSLRTHLWW